VEASPRNFALLSAGLKCNGAENVRAPNVAASRLEGVIGLYTPEHGYSGWGRTTARR
jgi:hypothetical protein